MTGSSRILLSNMPKLFRISDSSGQPGIQVKWVDFILGPLDTDYPAVTHFLFRPLQPNTARPLAIRNHKRPTDALTWDAVDEVDWSGGEIRVRDMHTIQPIEEGVLDRAVLVVRDILDAYVIDLQNRRLRRANDLLLEDLITPEHEQHTHQLQLSAADTGAPAVIRRLFSRLYRGSSERDLQDWKFVEFLRGEPGAVTAGAGYHRRIERQTPGEIANLAEGLPYLHAAELILLLPHKLAADTLELMTPERQLQVFEELDEATALPILELMAPDIAADLIGRLATEQARHYLGRLPNTCSERIIQLLRFPENTVGSIMTNDMIAIPGDLTVAEARQRLRSQLLGPDFVYFLYVVDNDVSLRLRGVVTLRSILVASDDECLEQIMNPYLQTLSPLDSPRNAAYELIKSQLAALPVTAKDGRLLGVVTVDAAVSLVAPGAWSAQAPRVFS